MNDTLEVPELSYEELCELLNQRRAMPRSTNPDYQRCEALADQAKVAYQYFQPVFHIVGAAYEYLAGPQGGAVTPEQVLALLSQPWRAALAQLRTYPPADEALLYVRVLAAFASNPDETGSHARSLFESAQHLMQAVVAYPAIQAKLTAEEQERVAAEAAWQQQLADEKAAWKKKLRWQTALDMLWQALLFGLGIAVGWLMAKQG